MRNQRGFVMAWWGYALILAFVGAAGWAVVAKYNSAIEKATKLERENADLNGALKDQLADNMFLRAEKGRLDALLARREGVRQGDAKARGELDAKLEKLFRENREAKEWGDQPVPAAVIDGLRLRPSTTLGDEKRKADPARKPAR